MVGEARDGVPAGFGEPRTLRTGRLDLLPHQRALLVGAWDGGAGTDDPPEGPVNGEG